MIITSKPHLEHQFNALAQRDLSKIGAHFAYTGYAQRHYISDYSNVNEHEKGEIAWFDFSLFEFPVPPYHYAKDTALENRCVVTAIPAFVKPLRTPEETYALIEYMKSMAIRYLPTLYKIPFNVGGATHLEELHFYCFADLQEELLESHLKRISQKIDETAKFVSEAIGIHGRNAAKFCNRIKDVPDIDLIPFSKYYEEYFNHGKLDDDYRRKLREYSATIFEQYQRYVICQDDSNKLRIVRVGLNGIADSVDRQRPKDTTTVLIEMHEKPSSEELLGFEDRINSSSVKESDLQQFLEEHPSILNIFGKTLVAYPQIVLRNPDNTVLKPDFLLEPNDGGRALIMDLKLPVKKIVLTQKNRERFYAHLYEYIAQLKQYGRYFDSYANRRWFRNKYGFEPFEPECILLMGKDYGNIDYKLIHLLRNDIYPITLLTYQDIINSHRKLGNRN